MSGQLRSDHLKYSHLEVHSHYQSDLCKRTMIQSEKLLIIEMLRCHLTFLCGLWEVEFADPGLSCPSSDHSVPRTPYNEIKGQGHVVLKDQSWAWFPTVSLPLVNSVKFYIPGNRVRPTMYRWAFYVEHIMAMAWSPSYSVRLKKVIQLQSNVGLPP